MVNALVNTDPQRLCCCCIYITQELKRPSLVPACGYSWSSCSVHWPTAEMMACGHGCIFYSWFLTRWEGTPFRTWASDSGLRLWWTAPLSKALCPRLKLPYSNTWNGCRREGWVGIGNACSACAMACTLGLWEAGLPTHSCIIRHCSLLPNQVKFACTTCWEPSL